ncbi:MAG: hypothetical protein WC010_00770 [Candidatus Absconditabacterales bacterium]
MKKYLLVVIVFSLVFLGCKRNDITQLDINTIVDIPTLQITITQVSEEMNEGKITLEQAQLLVEQLQQKYIDLTDKDINIETTFDNIQKSFDEKLFVMYKLPFWAKKLGMIEPQGMELNKTLSTYVAMNDSGYFSVVLVYTGDYTIALQQAKLIAEKAQLHVSKDFAKAQLLANVGNTNYISGLDIAGLSKGIIYLNHELLETNIDNLLLVSVDSNGVLTLETTKYRN